MEMIAKKTVKNKLSEIIFFNHSIGIRSVNDHCTDEQFNATTEKKYI